MWFRNELSSLAEVSLYCHLCTVQPHHIFPHYLINGTIFGEKSYWTQKAFHFLYNVCLKHFSSPEEPSEIWPQIFWFQWPRGLRRGSVANCLLGLRVRISPGGMDHCLLWVMRVVRYRSVCQADHSSRGVLPSVVSEYNSEVLILTRPWSLGAVLNVHRSLCKVPVILIRFKRYLNFLDTFKKKSSNIKFHGNPSSRSWVVPRGRTDRQTEGHNDVNSRFTQFGEGA